MPEINTEADERLSAQVSEVIAKYDLLCDKMNTAVDEKTARAETVANNAASALEELKNAIIASDYVTNAHLQEELSTKQPTGDYATNAALLGKANASHTQDWSTITNKPNIPSGGAAPKPQATAGIGQIVPVQYNGANMGMTLPSGGTWAYFAVNFEQQTSEAGVKPGGSLIKFGVGCTCGFAWRIG